MQDPVIDVIVLMNEDVTQAGARGDARGGLAWVDLVVGQAQERIPVGQSRGAFLGAGRDGSNDVLVHINRTQHDALDHTFYRRQTDRVGNKFAVADIAKYRELAEIIGNELEFATDEFRTQHAAAPG